MNEIDVIFFDLGDTLGSAVVSAPPPHLAGFNVYPFVPALLRRLSRAPGRLGVISNTGDDGAREVNRVLHDCGLLSYFEPSLLLYSKETGLKKDTPDVFRLAAQRAGVLPERALFVGEDADERIQAQLAGLRVCPHPLLVEDVLAGDHLWHARIAPSHARDEAWKQVLADAGVVPLHVSGAEGESVIGILSQRVAVELFNRQFEVTRLGALDDPLTTQLYLLRDDRAARSGFHSPAGQSAALLSKPDLASTVIATTPEGILVAVPGDKSVEDYHFPQAFHGHNEKLMADPALLRPFGRGAMERPADFVAVLETPRAVQVAALDAAASAAIATISAAGIKNLVERFSGQQAMENGSPFRATSRHILSPGSQRIVEALARELAASGGPIAVTLHPFTHEGQQYHNVLGEIAGASSGNGRTVVIVCAHLDSTAASSPGYRAALDPAPGADDDASGVAAVLAIARALVSLPQPKSTIRFALFNAEEHGLVGSKAYARDQSQLAEPITAVFQMDMIGHNAVAPPTFQIHAGFLPSSDVQARSKALGELLQSVVRQVAAELPEPRLFQSGPGGPAHRDPAENRSDHSAFHQRGYAACAVTEDFAFGPSFDDPTAEVNPNYHRLSDTADQVDYEYAAAIARTVAAAAWVSANRP